MRRALACVLTAMLSLSAVVACAPTAAQASEPARWPTPEELRQELRDIGWQWGASFDDWIGGRVGAVEASNVFLGRVGRDDLPYVARGAMVVSVSIERSDVILPSWPAAVYSHWTAFREIAALLPIPEAAQMDIMDLVLRYDDGCRDIPIPGGNIIIESYGRVTIVDVYQGGTPGCGWEPPPVEDGASESPAA